MEIKLQKPSRKMILPAISALTMIIAIVVVSVNLGTQTHLHRVLIATKDIPVGETLSANNTELTALNLDSQNYLTEPPKAGRINQTILKGQLIPTQSISDDQDVRTPIRFNGLQTISEQLSIGDHVDIWATPNDHQPGTGAEVVAFDSIVTKVINISNMAINQTSVELRINPDYLVSVLEAKANGLSIELVLTETLADQP
jgi:cell division protein FtsL